MLAAERYRLVSGARVPSPKFILPPDSTVKRATASPVTLPVKILNPVAERVALNVPPVVLMSLSVMIDPVP